MKIIVLGAGGIIGQHMYKNGPRLVPGPVSAFFFRKHASADWNGVDLEAVDIPAFLDQQNPTAIVNLAGESRPDVVQRAPERYYAINVAAPTVMAHWCAQNKRHFVQVSTQAVFGGMPKMGQHQAAMARHFSAPYGPDSPRVPVNAYGAQKLSAEVQVAASGKYWTIVRPTFVLGVRPDPTIGRENPVEQMLAPVSVAAEGETVATQRQVYDRWFSVSFAWDVAETLWDVAMGEPQCRAIHVGIPVRTNRHVLASYLRPDLTIEAVSHDSFEGLAPRPTDTTYAGEGSFAEIIEGLEICRAEYEARQGVAK